MHKRSQAGVAMGIQRIFPIFLGLTLLFSATVKADTLLDGYWQLDRTQSVTCMNNQSIVQVDAEAYLAKYNQLYLHLSNLQAVKYWLSPQGEMIASPVLPLTEIVPNQEYLLKHPGTSIPDVTLRLLNDQDQFQLEYRTRDYEWNLCQGGEYRVIFKYLRLNP